MLKTITNFISQRGIKYTLKTIIQYINMNKSINLFFNKWDKKTFSQYWEDLFIYRKLLWKKDWFYIDIGANHPTKLSNTRKFYDLWWSWVNIEPNPNLIKNFENERNRDINLNIWISNKNAELDFYVCSDDTLSTFSKDIAIELEKNWHKILTKKIEVKKLSDVLKENNINEIDFLSLDTEWYNTEVLKSNDWKKYRPKIICIEDDKRYWDMYDDFFYEIWYKKIGFNVTNIIFIDNAK